MVNIYEKITSTLASFGVPIREQGSYKPQEILPDTFITFLIINSPYVGFADNLPTSRITQIQISVYSTKPSIIQSADENIKSLMMPAGFMRLSGRPLPFEHITGHYAWTSYYRLYEMEE